MKWLSATDPQFTVNGLYWFNENNGKFIRLPERAKGVVREEVWNLGQHPSGGRVRFKTNTTSLKIKVCHDAETLATPHMCAVGQSGIDLYEGKPTRMDFWAATKPTEPKELYEHIFFENTSKQTHEFTLYLPPYNTLAELQIGIDDDATIEPPTPFELDKPVVVYGTSITQGGCASRSGNGFVPLMGRNLGIDVINLGFSGNGCCEPEVADLLIEIDAACYVIDPVANMGKVENEKKVYADFVAKIRAAKPDVPMILMTRIHSPAEFWRGPDLWNDVNAMAYEARDRLAGDANVYFLDAGECIKAGGDHPSVDGTHLTDLGFKILADALSPVIAKALRLNPEA